MVKTVTESKLYIGSFDALLDYFSFIKIKFDPTSPPKVDYFELPGQTVKDQLEAHEKSRTKPHAKFAEIICLKRVSKDSDKFNLEVFNIKLIHPKDRVAESIPSVGN